MNVMVVGSGGREHALIWKLSQSRHTEKIYAAPGNGGTAALATNLTISDTDIPALVAAAEEHDIDLTIVGPEAPLAAGLVDAFTEAGLKAFGPTAAAARIESSKLWSKNLMAKYGIPALRESGGGTFLITTSVASQIGFPQHAVYCASKAASEALVRCLATDYAGIVRVVGISPGTVKTPMLAASCQGWDKPVEELYAEIAEKIPVRRLGEPQDIAKAAAFLLGDEASYINGTILTLDGGTQALPPW